MTIYERRQTEVAADMLDDYAARCEAMCAQARRDGALVGDQPGVMLTAAVCAIVGASAVGLHSLAEEMRERLLPPVPAELAGELEEV